MTIADIDVADLPALTTKKQVAKWAGCSDRHIDKLVKDGKFPGPVRFGSHPRWRRSDLQAWLDAQSNVQPPKCQQCHASSDDLLQLQTGELICTPCHDAK